MLKRFFGVFLALALVLTLIASFVVFRSAPSTASAHSTIAFVIDHQQHIHLSQTVFHCPVVCTIHFTVSGVNLGHNDTYILSTSGLMPPSCSGNDSNATAIKTDSIGNLPPKLVTAGGCHHGTKQVELLDAENQSEYWYATLTVVP